jgi:hypothetical protein
MIGFSCCRILNEFDFKEFELVIEDEPDETDAEMSDSRRSQIRYVSPVYVYVCMRLYVFSNSWFGSDIILC